MFIERSDIFFYIYIYIIIYYFAYITFKVHHILQHIYLGLKKLFRFFGEIKTHTDVVEILKIHVSNKVFTRVKEAMPKPKYCL